MSRLVKIVNNKYVQIEEYKNPNICFNTNEYDNFEDYCTLRETFDPFEIFYENQELKKQLEEIEKFKFSYRKDETKIPPIIRKQKDVEIIKNLKNQQKEFIKFLEDNYKQTQDIWYIKILQKYKSIIGVSDEKEN